MKLELECGRSTMPTSINMPTNINMPTSINILNKSSWQFSPFQPIGNCYILYHDVKRKILITVGPHWYGPIFALSVIFGGTYLFCDILENKKHVFSNFIFQVLKGFVLTSSSLASIFLILTACCDPGIVVLSPNYMYDQHDEQSSDWCEKCSVSQLRRYRIRHCDECDLCIEGIDHHCPWVGKCIGKKNMKWFISFNVCWVLSIICLLVVAIIF